MMTEWLIDGLKDRPADDTDVVCVLQLLCCGVRVQGVHVVDGAAGQYHVVERLNKFN